MKRAESCCVQTDEITQEKMAALPPLLHPIGVDRVVDGPPPPAPRTDRTLQLGAAGQQTGPGKTAKGIGLGIGIVVAAAFIVGCVILVQMLNGTTIINNVETGDCLEDFFPTDSAGQSEILLVQTTDCANPHALEVFATTETAYVFPDFPGQEQVFVIGQSFCHDEFEKFTGVAFEESPYEMWALVPVENSWSQGDRKVQCLIASSDGTTLIEGSLRNNGVRV